MRLEFGDTDVPLQHPLPFVEVMTSAAKPHYALTDAMRARHSMHETFAGVVIPDLDEDE